MPEDPGPSTARKLGLQPGHDVALVGAPRGWLPEPVPDGTRLRRRRPSGQVDVLVAFFRRLADLEAQVAALGDAITPEGALWVAWPRRAGGHHSDITDECVRAAALPLGLVDVKVAALDEDWSALKLVWRRQLRPGRSSPRGRG